MNKIITIVFFLISTLIPLNADSNSSKETNASKAKSIAEKQIKEQMKREEKYSKEQRFYQGDEYDLKGAEVNKKSLSKIPVIEPDYDFDMDDVYSD